MSSVYTNEARRWVVVVVGSGEKVDIGEEREDVITLMDNEQDDAMFIERIGPKINFP